MKNFFRTTLYLSVFAIAGIMFQISCSNSDDSPSATPASTGKLLYFKTTSGNINGVFTANYDGTGETEIPIVLPNGGVLDGTTLKFSADGQRIFFKGGISGTNTENVYSCNLDGTDLQSMLPATWPNAIDLHDIN